jgi:hypothetical protein
VRNRLGRHPQRLAVGGRDRPRGAEGDGHSRAALGQLGHRRVDVGGVGHPARFLLVAEHQIHVVE